MVPHQASLRGPSSEGGARFIAWFDSRCWFCGYSIMPGDRVHYVAKSTLCHARSWLGSPFRTKKKPVKLDPILDWPDTRKEWVNADLTQISILQPRSRAEMPSPGPAGDRRVLCNDCGEFVEAHDQITGLPLYPKGRCDCP